MPESYPELYFPVLLQALLAVAVAAGILAASHLLGRRVRSKAKDQPYECGIPPAGDARGRFSVKFYLVAMLFILFDVEIVFLFPWAAVYRDLKLYGFFSMLLYMTVILAGFFYVWKKGVLDWTGEKDETADEPR
jgi:NADH-quinone oxidoreductase subunit A